MVTGEKDSWGVLGVVGEGIGVVGGVEMGVVGGVEMGVVGGVVLSGTTRVVREVVGGGGVVVLGVGGGEGGSRSRSDGIGAARAHSTPWSSTDSVALMLGGVVRVGVHLAVVVVAMAVVVVVMVVVVELAVVCGVVSAAVVPLGR